MATADCLLPVPTSPKIKTGSSVRLAMASCRTKFLKTTLELFIMMRKGCHRSRPAEDQVETNVLLGIFVIFVAKSSIFLNPAHKNDKSSSIFRQA
jgi:hypothetical protein